MALPDNITPLELQGLLEQGTELCLLDVREENEWDICHLEGAILAPLSSFDEWIGGILERQEPLIVYCHTGVRSLHICTALRHFGVNKAINLIGGIERWATEIADGTPRY